MKRQSWERKAKRRAMKANGMTFTDRLREACRTGKPVVSVTFRNDKKEPLPKVNI